MPNWFSSTILTHLFEHAPEKTRKHEHRILEFLNSPDKKTARLTFLSLAHGHPYWANEMLPRMLEAFHALVRMDSNRSSVGLLHTYSRESDLNRCSAHLLHAAFIHELDRIRGGEKRTIALETMTEHQRRALIAIAELEGAWRIHSSWHPVKGLMTTLRELGLPNRREELLEWLKSDGHGE